MESLESLGSLELRGGDGQILLVFLEKQFGAFPESLLSRESREDGPSWKDPLF